MQHIHLHRGLEVRQRGSHLPMLALELGEVGYTVDLRIEQCSDESNPTGPAPRHAEVVAHLSEHQRLWQGSQCLSGEP
jgi:hypothetical protein